MGKGRKVKNKMDMPPVLTLIREMCVRYLRLFSLCLLPLAILLSGCDQVSRHKVLTTIFEGVPSLPDPEEMCEEYHEQEMERYLAGLAEEALAMEGKVVEKSSHKPFKEKKCKDCHDFTTDVGLIRPKLQLCLVCHTGFIKGRYVHGPVSVGDCSACHLPHISEFVALLEMDRNRICEKCHTEERLAVNMHEQVMTHGMDCVDCHDPHYGDTMYFLR